MSTIIDDNINADNDSFLYYLHEENTFHVEKLIDLCTYINALDCISIINVKRLYFIENQAIRHIAYHFDPNDCSEISNLPDNYWDYIDTLDYAINNIEIIISI